MEKMTDVELQIMNCIWSVENPVTPTEILSVLNERYDRGWTLQTLCTYLLRMAGKGYLKYQKQKRQTFYSALISKSDYFEQTAIEYSEFWGKGILKHMAATLIEANRITAEEIQELKDYLDKVEC